MSLREKIIRRTVEDNARRESLLVAPWGESVYYTPLTIKERALIRKGAMVPDREKPGELILDYELFDVLTVLHKALDETGQRVFNLADREFLETEAAAGAVAAISRAVHGRGEDKQENP